MPQRARRWFGVLLLLCLSPMVHAADEQKPIMVTDPENIAAAMALNEALDQLTRKVMQCAQKGLAASQEKCFCLYSPESDKVREKYEIALKRNPEWKDRVIFWTIKGAVSSYTLAFARIRGQLETKCGN